MTILIKKKHPKLPVSAPKARAFLRKALRLLGIRDKEISIFFTDDEGIRDLNRIYRGQDSPTDVLSFSQISSEEAGAFPNENGEEILGDIVISIDTAGREAESAAIPYEDVLDLLLLHGLLHLLGYDHEGVTEEREEQMRAKEEEIFSQIKGSR